MFFILAFHNCWYWQLLYAFTATYREFSSPSVAEALLILHGYDRDFEAFWLVLSRNVWLWRIGRPWVASGPCCNIWRVGSIFVPFPVVGVLVMAMTVATWAAIGVTEARVNALGGLVTSGTLFLACLIRFVTSEISIVKVLRVQRQGLLFLCRLPSTRWAKIGLRSLTTQSRFGPLKAIAWLVPSLILVNNLWRVDLILEWGRQVLIWSWFLSTSIATGSCWTCTHLVLINLRLIISISKAIPFLLFYCWSVGFVETLLALF